MTFLRALIALAIGIGIGVGASQAAELRPMPKATVSIAVHNPQVVRQELVAAMNAARQAAGVGPLQLNPKLSQAAQAHADDMTRRQYFSHVSPEGHRAKWRAKRAGYRGCLVAENLSYSWKNVGQSVEAWMQSEGHRKNLLHPAMKDVGVGIGPNNLFVAVFAKPCR